MSSVMDNSARTQPRRRSLTDPAVPSESSEHPSSAGAADRLVAQQPIAGSADSPFILEARQLVKVYRKNKLEVPVLSGCDFQAVEGKMTAILGQSGSGKSTLLHLLGTLDLPDAGEIYFDGLRIDKLSRGARDRFRNRSLGMIFQFYHLLPEVSALQNVLLPLMIQRGVWSYFRERRIIRQRAIDLLERVGLGHRLHHKPRELSGGEMQRTAIARALVANPRLLLADEPTGNLDRSTGQEIIKLLRELNHEQRLTIVMVTHDESIAADCDAIIHLADGRIQGT
jgi:lipoprotein-releasing system ATP-binding protein